MTNDVRRATRANAIGNIRVLGLYIAASGHNSATSTRLDGVVTTTFKLLRRIANRESATKESNMTRLVMAFEIRQTMYLAPYLKGQVVEKARIGDITRKASKQAIWLPINTRTSRVLDLGLINTLGEFIKAHTIVQYQRLS